MKLYFVSPLFLQKLIWIPTRLIFWFFGRLEVRGLENLNGIKTNVIFATNHSSELDPLLIPASLPFWSRFSPLFYPTREKTFYGNCGWRRHFFGGHFINLWGGYPVFVGLHDFGKSMTNHIRIIRDGGNLCVFPEGGKTPDGTIQPAKGGVAFLAEHTHCPIIPVGISGAYQTPLMDFFLRKRKIVVRFGSAISPDELRAHVGPSATADGNMYKEKSEHVMGRIKRIIDPPHRKSIATS